MRVGRVSGSDWVPLHCWRYKQPCLSILPPSLAWLRRGWKVLGRTRRWPQDNVDVKPRHATISEYYYISFICFLSLILTFRCSDGPILLKSFHKICPILLVNIYTCLFPKFILSIEETFLSDEYLFNFYYYLDLDPIMLSRLFDFLNKYLIPV